MSSSPEFSGDESSTSSGPIFHLPIPTASVDAEQDGANPYASASSRDIELDATPSPESNFLLRMRNIDISSEEDRDYLRAPKQHDGPAAMQLFSDPDPDGKLYFVLFGTTNLPFFPSSEPMDPARDPQPWISGRFEVNPDYHVHPSRDGKGGSAAPREPRRAPGGTLVTEAPRLPRQGLVLGQLYTQSPDLVNGGVEMHRALFDVIVNADPGVANPEVYIIYNSKVMREWYEV